MKLIITRPVADAQPLAAQLVSRGHAVVRAPLLEIRSRADAALPAGAFQAVCITSANGVLNTALLAPLLHCPCYCVGPQSAAAAQAAGFADVRTRGGNLTALAEAVATELAPSHGPLLYLSGAETSGDLRGTLTQMGFTVQRVIAYDAVPCPLLLTPQDLEDCDGVLLYSPRTAKLWTAALAAMPDGAADRLLHFCLSQNVAAQLPRQWRKRVADRPDEDHMLSMLDRMPEAE
jgi:uroporphyrinogen-III synthase